MAAFVARLIAFVGASSGMIFPPAAPVAALTLLFLTGCTTATQTVRPGEIQPRTTNQAPHAHASADSGRVGYTAADVRFMSNMIRHHAQAVLMARWAATHGASPAVRTVAERVLVTQQDEIAFMQRWLEERNEPVPDAELSHAGMVHDTHHGVLMPGMLTEEQLAQLDKATGPEFDRLFLTFMIQHHQGAVAMVEELFSAPGAGQHETVFQFAADVNADQNAEIDRMNRMLTTLSAGGN